ncbi:gluconate 2-dehydrogenase subunit 3 family protein [Burkholderia sp. LMU1-1-1.1]|uniref:gluconate 2-dehydrogenase subunit 3 family protein n=1 Tax=Burkholderia sp. LMU1-1-1.1 TaxID=3135266 RepID=UPI0034140E5F
MLHAEREIDGRRSALIKLAGLCGLALSGDALAALAASGKAPAAPGLLSADALALTAVLAEHIIPATDTPGALAVGAHRTIDHMLTVCATASEQQSFIAGLERIDAMALAADGKRFRALPAKHRIALLHALDGGTAPFTADDQRFFRTLKSYTLFAYYTSEAGSTLELAYLPVPGGYKGNFPVRKNTRTWAII